MIITTTKKIIGIFILFLFPNALYGSEIDDIIVRLHYFDPVQYQMALEDLSKSFPGRFVQDPQTASLLQRMKERQPVLVQQIEKGDQKALKEATDLLVQLDAQMLKNPLLADKKVMAIKRTVSNARSVMGANFGLPLENFHNHSDIPNPTLYNK